MSENDLESKIISTRESSPITMAEIRGEYEEADGEADEDPTNGEIIAEKLIKMRDFILAMTDVDGNDFRAKNMLVADLKVHTENISEFTKKVIVNILPFRNNLDALLPNYLRTYGIDINTIKATDRDKIKLYLEFFCYIASS